MLLPCSFHTTGSYEPSVRQASMDTKGQTMDIREQLHLLYPFLRALNHQPMRKTRQVHGTPHPLVIPLTPHCSAVDKPGIARQSGQNNVAHPQVIFTTTRSCIQACWT